MLPIFLCSKHTVEYFGMAYPHFIYEVSFFQIKIIKYHIILYMRLTLCSIRIGLIHHIRSVLGLCL